MRESPLPRGLRFLGPPLSGVYARIIGARNRNFDDGKGVVEIDRPVLSVGNLSVGGTGKTPMVSKIVRWLLEAGHRPAIAMRGYRSGAGESDEAAEYRAELAEVPLIVRPDRLEALLDFFRTAEGALCDCIVLDDGFQHRRIARQLDVVLVDATHDPFSDRLLPAGWLREPVGSLRRAGFVVVTHAEGVERGEIGRITDSIQKEAPGIAVAVCRHSWTGLRAQLPSGERDEYVAWLRGKRVIAACGIGNPGAFVRAVKDATGREPVAFIRPDHDPFAPHTIRDLLDLARHERADAIVVTGKDWSKLKRVKPEAWPCPVVRPILEMPFDSGEDVLRNEVLRAVVDGVPAGEE